jgi:hypothetical protein
LQDDFRTEYKWGVTEYKITVENNGHKATGFQLEVTAKEVATLYYKALCRKQGICYLLGHTTS